MKNKQMKSILLTLAFVVMSIGFSIAGGPWPQAKGKGYFKLSESWIVFNQHFAADGSLASNTKTGIFNTNFYGEYGITNKLTGIVNGPFLTRNYMDNVLSATTGEVLIPSEAVNTLGDIDLGLKYGVKVSSLEIPVSATLIFGLPTGKMTAGTNGNLQTGDGEFNQMLQIDAGSGFNLSEKVNSYVSAYVGFNNRTNGFSDEFRYGLESGVGFMDRKLWVIGRIGGVESLKNGEETAPPTFISLFSNNTAYNSFSIETAYYITKRVGISASFAGAFTGELIAAAPTYSVGFFYDLSK